MLKKKTKYFLKDQLDLISQSDVIIKKKKKTLVNLKILTDY